jgi:hypothetical protein
MQNHARSCDHSIAISGSEKASPYYSGIKYCASLLLQDDPCTTDEFMWVTTYTVHNDQLNILLCSLDWLDLEVQINLQYRKASQYAEKENIWGECRIILRKLIFLIATREMVRMQST